MPNSGKFDFFHQQLYENDFTFNILKDNKLIVYEFDWDTYYLILIFIKI